MTVKMNKWYELKKRLSFDKNQKIKSPVSTDPFQRNPWLTKIQVSAATTIKEEQDLQSKLIFSKAYCNFDIMKREEKMKIIINKTPDPS